MKTVITRLFPTVVVMLTFSAAANGQTVIDKITYYSRLSESRFPLVMSTETPNVGDALVHWPTFNGVHQTGSVNVNIDCYGCIGNPTFGSYREEVPSFPVVGFETPVGHSQEYLAGGGLWFGGIIDGDTAVSISYGNDYSWVSEFLPPGEPDSGSVRLFDGPADYCLRTESYDTVPAFYIADDPHVPLGLKIVVKSYSWHTPPYDKCILHDYIITNIGDRDIRQAYAGLFFDCDISCRSTDTYLDDLAGSIRSEGITYMIDNDGNPVDGVYVPDTSLVRIFAFKLLASYPAVVDTSFNWWLSYAYSIDFGPRLSPTPDDPFFDFGTGGLGRPERDPNKYYIMRHREWDYDQIYTASFVLELDTVWLYPDPAYSADIATGQDSRILTSFGPYDLPPGETIRFLVTTFTADSVHTDPTNISRLPYYPDGYRARLNLASVVAGAAIADSLMQLVLNPYTPVTGVAVEAQGADTARVCWDPWVLDNVEGYEIYLSPIPDSALPYPGVAPPWLEPTTFNHLASTDVMNTYTLRGLDSNTFYYLNVAHRTSSGVGPVSTTVHLSGRGLWRGPRPSSDYIYCHENEPVTLNWQGLSDADLDHYNIYRFDDSESFAHRYTRFYDDGYFRDIIAPRDSFLVGGTTYYYYAMTPFATVDSGVTTFTDSDPIDGGFYVVSGTDKYGFESQFSDGIQTLEIPYRTRDILLVTQSSIGPLEFTLPDTITTFYQSILDGYDYAIYRCHDTEATYTCNLLTDNCVNWRDLMPFELVILDDDLRDRVLSMEHEDLYRTFAKYLGAGGKLAYFGPLTGLNSYGLSSPAISYYQDYWLTRRFFGIDSIFFVSPMYYQANPVEPFEDSLFGFIRAESASSEFHDIAYDVFRNPLDPVWNQYWPVGCAPGVSTFSVNSSGSVIHRFHSRYPTTTLLEGRPVGIKTVTDSTQTYLFGFHLWYMEPQAARQLIDDIFTSQPEPPEPEVLPDHIVLQQNYPNPFNPATVISFELPTSATVTLDIYNVLGQRVKTLTANSDLPAGTHYFVWDGTGDNMKPVATGIYLYRLTAGAETASRKMMLIK